MIRAVRTTEPALAGLRPDAYPADPGFPLLEIAVDPMRMLEIFRAHLKPAPGRALRIQSCAPFRFRCRQSRSRCVLQYSLRVMDEGTGRQWNQWVTGLLYAGNGDARKVFEELSTPGRVTEIPEAWRSFEPVSFVPDLDMVVEVFPCDRRVPQLGRVLEVAACGVAPLLLPRLGPGRWEVEGVAIDPSRYRTEMGAAFRCTLSAREAGGRRSAQRCFLKVYRNERGAETYEFLEEWLRRPRDGRWYSLLKPLGYWSELRTLVLEEAEGRSLHTILIEEDDPRHALRVTARALAAFHLDRVEARGVWDLAEELASLGRAASQIQWALPRLRRDVEDIAATVSSSLVEVEPTTVHGDFKPDHVFLSEGRAIFIDLDSVVRGDPARDAAHLCSYVLGREGLEPLSRDRARALTCVFADEYFSRVPAAWRRQFALHTAGSLIDVACAIFRNQRPGWREHVAAAVEEARYALSGARA